jgi:putative pyruvate formate lyase activating enzyme
MRYHDLYISGELITRVKTGYARLRCCNLCPHDCRINRLKGETGICRSGANPKVASANVHRGEEPPISGTRGSGTVFFSGCTLRCQFCQNFPISQLGSGEEITPKELARRMLKLQGQGVHNINLVTPTHFMPQFLAALYLAIPLGFNLPIVWNSSGYERVDTLEFLEDIVAIYLPDMKYSAEEPAMILSGAPDYVAINRSAVAQMFRQVGNLRLDSDGIAAGGLIIRHLVLPENRAGSYATLRWIAENLGQETHVALMNQYFPAYQTPELAGMNRKITEEEYEEAVEALEDAGLENGWVQD